jgi:predicted Zn-dependent peptidase
MHLGQSVLRKGKANSIEHAIESIKKVTVSDVLEVANELMAEDDFSRLYYVPQD